MLNILNVSSLTHIVLSVYYVYKEINCGFKNLNIFDVEQAVERQASGIWQRFIEGFKFSKFLRYSSSLGNIKLNLYYVLKFGSRSKQSNEASIRPSTPLPWKNIYSVLQNPISSFVHSY